MTKFNIFNRAGDFLGTYDGDTAESALDAYARDAGYMGYADLVSLSDREPNVFECRAEVAA